MKSDGCAILIGVLSNVILLGCRVGQPDERLGHLQQADIIFDPGPPSDDQWFPVGPAPIGNGLLASPLVGDGVGGGTSAHLATTGRASAIANNPQLPLQFWLGMAGGGLWQSQIVADANHNATTVPFQLMFDQWPAIGAITLDPDSCTTTRCNDVLVGTGEGKLRRQTLYGIGIFEGIFSSRGGEFPTEGYTFTRLPGSEAFTGGSINDIVIDKTGGTRRIFATVMPGIYPANPG